MSRLFFSCVLTFIFCVGTISCSDENQEFLELQEEPIETRSVGAKTPCYSVQYPVSLLFPDGAIVEVSDKKERLRARRTYRRSDTVGGPIQYVFPITIKLSDGTEHEVSSKYEIKTLTEPCRLGKQAYRCFILNFPIILQIPGQDNIEVNDREEFNRVCKDYRGADRGSKERVTISYPYSVTFQDGSVLELKSEADQETLRATCPREEGERRQRQRERRIYDRS